MTSESRRIVWNALTAVAAATPATWPSVYQQVQQALAVMAADSADPLATERAAFFHRLSHGATMCPVCTRNGVINCYSISGGLARSLLKLYNLRRPAHVKQFRLLDGGGLLCVLKHHGLIMRPPGDRSRGASRSGKWLISQRGVDWIEARITVAQYVWVFADRPLQFSPEQVTFQECLQSTWTPQQQLAGATP